jgi:hypothetical protein
MSGKLAHLKVNGGDYYGVSWSNNALYYCQSNIDPMLYRIEEDYYKYRVATLQQWGSPTALVMPGVLSQPHQMLVADDKLYIANTGMNSIFVYDLKSGQSNEVYPTHHRCDMSAADKTGNHFNSITVHNNHVYLVAHNNGRASEVYKLDASSLEVVDVYRTSALWAHNLWVNVDQLVICDSKHSCLRDAITDSIIWHAEEDNVIARGLAVNDKYIYIGRSEMGDRRTRRISNGGYWIVDRHTMTTVACILHKGIGCVNELRLISGKDYAHNAFSFPMKMPLTARPRLKDILVYHLNYWRLKSQKYA